MSKQKRNLSHPILGVREFPTPQADAIMALGKANGGWEEIQEKEKEASDKLNNSPKGQKKNNANTTNNIAGGSKKAKASKEK